MWIISNDHTKFVELTGMLSVDKVKESYVVLHNGVELVYCDSENAACKIITDIAETIEDVLQFKEIVDYDTHPCEWATKIGKDTGYVSALYLLNDDFVVVLYLPQSIAPEAILKDLEEGI